MINERFVQFPIGDWEIIQQYIVIMMQWNGTM